MPPPTVYVFAGLPGTGKSTLARALATHLGAAYLRIDTIEQVLAEARNHPTETEGYLVAYRIAADILASDVSVVADACNPISLTRAAWRQVAETTGANLVGIFVHCSDPTEHEHRVESRLRPEYAERPEYSKERVPGLRQPTYTAVLTRTMEPWPEAQVDLDTAGETPEASFQHLLRHLSHMTGSIPARAKTATWSTSPRPPQAPQT
jgi:predicted kinase